MVCFLSASDPALGSGYQSTSPAPFSLLSSADTSAFYLENPFSPFPTHLRLVPPAGPLWPTFSCLAGSTSCPYEPLLAAHWDRPFVPTSAPPTPALVYGPPSLTRGCMNSQRLSCLWPRTSPCEEIHWLLPGSHGNPHRRLLGQDESPPICL